MKLFIRIFYLGWLFFALPFLLSCDSDTLDQPGEKIIARIDDKTISVNEFIRRAEYTIRPEYCRRNNYFHKKIILNSLISEKLFSLEAGEQNDLTDNEQFKLYLKGRKEQAMRQWLYYHDFYKKAAIDRKEIERAYTLSNRTYKVAYYTIKDSSIVQIVKQKLEQGVSFEHVFRQMGGMEDIPKREVKWDQPEHEAIQNALFSAPLRKDQVIGPIKIDNQFYMVMKIVGWKDQFSLSDRKKEQKYSDARQIARQKKADAAYVTFVKNVMKGKSVQFYPETFVTVVNALAPFYIKTDQEKKEAFEKQFWNCEQEEMTIKGFAKNLAQIQDKPFLKIDNEIWTVADLERELAVHPLVFRKREMEKNEFGEQFKLAVVDLIRDKFVAKEAYQRGYDKINMVQRNVQMWRDYLTALYHKNQLLNKWDKADIFADDYISVIEINLNPYVDKLQNKYSDRIEIDTDLFEQTKLSRVDMFVIRKNVPFATVVPSFPIITTDDKLDYGKKMQ